MAKKKAADLKEGVGKLTARAISDILTGSLPDIAGDLADSQPIRDLEKGDLAATTRIAVDLAESIQHSVQRVQANPFYGDISDVAKSFVGAPIQAFFGEETLSLRSGIIVKTAGYTGEADLEKAGFDVYDSTPGTIGIWKGGRNTEVACIAAHPQGQRGYVAIHSVREAQTSHGMTDVAKLFAFNQKEGTQIIAPRSSIKVFPRGDISNFMLTENHRVYKAPHTKLGKDCICAWELKAKR